jgi:C4-dicarboxylate transporter
MRKKFLVKQKYLLILKIKNKMKNLQELSLNEMRKIEGGNLGLAIVLICVLAYYMTRENDRDK